MRIFELAISDYPRVMDHIDILGMIAGILVYKVIVSNHSNR